MEAPVVLLLNGASSAGKSTLARLLQERLEAPHLIFAEDDFWSKLPARELPFEVWRTTYYGFLHCIAALARSGSFLIVDTVSDDRDGVQETLRLLEGVPTLFIGVHCALDVLEARERARGDRGTGTARSQFERVHRHWRYDVEVDTSTATPEACVDAILAALYSRQ